MRLWGGGKVLLACALVGIAPSTISAQPMTPSQISEAVAACLEEVHATRGGLFEFYTEFDAFYDVRAHTLYDNATRVGDQRPLFVFRKCMTAHGFSMAGRSSDIDHPAPPPPPSEAAPSQPRVYEEPSGPAPDRRVYSPDQCIGAIVNGVCHGSIMPDGGNHPTCHGEMLGGICTGPMF